MKKNNVLNDSENKCNRLNAYMILEVLKKHSNKDYPLGRAKIVELISKDYGVYVAPHTINKMMNLLASIECLEIVGKELVGKAKDGYYLLNPKFSQSEAAFIIHAIYSSKSLKPEMANALVHKINDDISEFDKLSIDNLVGGEKTDTNIINIFDTIKAINKGINQKRQISFYYCTYDFDGKLISRLGNIRVTVNPYYMINNRGAYYLISSEPNGDDIKTYRVDFMDGVQIENSSICPIEILKAYQDRKFSLREYSKDHVYFADGKVVDAKIVIHKSRTIGAVKDWFGSSAKIFSNGNQIVANIHNDEEALFFWCMQYCKEVTAIEPKSLVEKIKSAVHELDGRYSVHKIDDSHLSTTSQIFNKYNIYLNLDEFNFIWDTATIMDFYYEISCTKEGNLKPIASFYCKKPVISQNKIV